MMTFASNLKVDQKKRRNLRRTHQEYGNPGQADIVERHGSLKRVLVARPALGVVLVPVDTRAVCGQVWIVRPRRLQTLQVCGRRSAQIRTAYQFTVLTGKMNVCKNGVMLIPPGTKSSLN